MLLSDIGKKGILKDQGLQQPLMTKTGYYDVRGAYDKFPDFSRMGTFIYSTHMKL